MHTPGGTEGSLPPYTRSFSKKRKKKWPGISLSVRPKSTVSPLVGFLTEPLLPPGPGGLGFGVRLEGASRTGHRPGTGGCGGTTCAGWVRSLLPSLGLAGRGPGAVREESCTQKERREDASPGLCAAPRGGQQAVQAAGLGLGRQDAGVGEGPHTQSGRMGALSSRG